MGRTSNFDQIKSGEWPRSALALLLILVVSLLAASCGDAPNREQPVGRLHLALSDNDRTSWSGDGPRPLAATVWYPASSDHPEQPWRAGVFRFGYSALNAPFVDTARRPLIVLSHGTGGSAAQLSWLAERLVVGGYIVAAVNHHGNTAVEPQQWPAAFVLPSERSRDLTVLIDQLLEHSAVGTHIDPKRIGAAGFSLGGYSALGLAGIQLPSFSAWEQRCNARPESSACQLPPEAEFERADIGRMKSSDPAFQAALQRSGQSIEDHRIGAVYAIAPALISLMRETDLPGDVEPAIKVVLAKDDEQISLSQTKQFLEASLPQSEIRTIDKATHYIFLAPCSIRGKLFLRALCSNARGVDRREVHAEVGRDAVAFFDSALHQ